MNFVEGTEVCFLDTTNGIWCQNNRERQQKKGNIYCVCVCVCLKLLNISNQ